MCKPKSAGGLGLSRTKDMNAALLAKLGWSMANMDNKLWVSFFAAKYLKGRSFWNIKVSPTSSWVWKSVLSSRELLSKGICWKIGDVRGLEVWDNPWIPSLEGFKPSPISQSGREPLQVSELILNNPPRWDLNKLKSVSNNTVKAIQNIHLSQSPQPSKLCWAPSSTGKFTAKSAYWLDQQPRFENLGPLSPAEWKSLWNLKIHERLKLFLWKLAWGLLPTMATLNVRFRVNST